jgi:hypothetical protein
MLAVPLCGGRVVARLAAIGIRRLDDLRGRDPYEVVHQVNLHAGHTVWTPPIAIQAITNLVEAAHHQPPPTSAGDQR